MQYQVKDHEFVFEPTAPFPILADKTRIEQVLCNLLTNAVKYSPKSRTITISINQVGQNTKVAVKDQGIGIALDKLPFIFDRFFRVHASSQVFSGLGLGLFIAAEIIKQHDGKIGVESRESEGSVFWFSLPIHEITA